MIYIHVSPNGLYLGNGGLNMIAQLAEAMSLRLGYRVTMFCHDGKLDRHRLDWLDLSNSYAFRTYEGVPEFTSDDVVISCWVSDGLMRVIGNAHLAYWDHSELLRKSKDRAREIVRSHCAAIAIAEPCLEQHYRAHGFDNIVHLRNWMRAGFANRYYPRLILVGHQRGRRDSSAYRALSKHFRTVLLCEGTQAEVARKMNQCQYFVFSERRHPDMPESAEVGPGLSVYEAMACGCTVISLSKHDGNRHLPIWFADTIDEAIEMIESGEENDTTWYIEKEVRFDSKREEAIRQWMRLSSS